MTRSYPPMAYTHRWMIPCRVLWHRQLSIFAPPNKDSPQPPSNKRLCRGIDLSIIPPVELVLLLNSVVKPACTTKCTLEPLW